MAGVSATRDDRGPGSPWLPFLAGALAGAAGLVLARAFTPRPGLDPRLLGHRRARELPPIVVVPGLLGSELQRPDGTRVWLNLGNALGYHDLGLPAALPLASSRDDLVPGGLLGADAALPRLFGFTEYADLVEFLKDFSLSFHVFTYDWRRDLVESARRLDEALDALAEARGEPDARFNVVGHSMGGLVARYYLRYGTAEPGGEVTWAGARRIGGLILGAVPSGGSIPSLDALLNGNRVGFSSTTLAAPIVAHMPALYQLLPPVETLPFLDDKAEPTAVDLFAPSTWERFAWGPYAPASRRRQTPTAPRSDHELEKAFLSAVLARASAFQAALARPSRTRCPVRVLVIGGDCLPTPARAVLPRRPGTHPRFEPWTRAEAETMLEAGDGRVTRASVLASHLPDAHPDEPGCGIPEVTRTIFGAADHHGLYGDATFQSILLRALLRRAAPAAIAPPATSA
jgi:pimeloyl-ACP methyl ester carboxylesterase